uniref:Uncharacterized protein n=1 Tax=viral metagenome TaxID=1070528 RepID=A0A2V0RAW1_9ZZZZ
MQYYAANDNVQKPRHNYGQSDKRRPQYGIDLTKKYEAEERMKSHEMEMNEMRMILDKLSAGKESIPMFFDPKDLAQGSYGVHIDKYLGRSPSDGPAGYIFQKVTYSAGAVASKTNVAGMYKVSPDHMGYIYHDADGSPSSAETTGELRINEDGADLASGDVNPQGISGEARLVPGDLILGAILQLIDGRAGDNRTGFVTAGLVSNESATPDAYGPNLANDPSTFITGSAISGGRTHAASGLQACSVASPNLNIYNPTIVQTATGELAPGQIGAPINAINISGISPNSTSSQVRFVLNVYALVGARQKTISHYTQPDPSFKMECLTRQFAEHPVSMVH